MKTRNQDKLKVRKEAEEILLNLQRELSDKNFEKKHFKHWVNGIENELPASVVLRYVREEVSRTFDKILNINTFEND